MITFSPQMLLPHFAPPNKISVPILKPIDFQGQPLFTQLHPIMGLRLSFLLDSLSPDQSGYT
jgi:hypothetical protein